MWLALVALVGLALVWLVPHGKDVYEKPWTLLQLLRQDFLRERSWGWRVLGVIVVASPIYAAAVPAMYELMPAPLASPWPHLAAGLGLLLLVDSILLLVLLNLPMANKSNAMVLLTPLILFLESGWAMYLGRESPLAFLYELVFELFLGWLLG